MLSGTRSQQLFPKHVTAARPSYPRYSRKTAATATMYFCRKPTYSTRPPQRMRQHRDKTNGEAEPLLPRYLRKTSFDLFRRNAFHFPTCPGY